MTCIVGLANDGVVYIGGDSCASNGHSMSTPNNPKVFISGDFIIGYTSSYRFGQILESTVNTPKPREGQDVSNYMRKDFADSIRTALKDGGALKTVNGVDDGGFALIGYKGRLYTLQCDFSVMDMTDVGDATGSGELVATGSLHTTRSMEAFKGKPEERITLALQAAADSIATVSPPFEILSL